MCIQVLAWLIDCGTLWKISSPLADLGAATRFERLLDKSISYHVYKVEPQSHSYLIQGICGIISMIHLSRKTNKPPICLGLWGGFLGLGQKKSRQALSLSGFLIPYCRIGINELCGDTVVC